MVLHYHPSPLAAVPDGVLAGFALVALPSRGLGLAAMACLQLKRCADEVILQRARSANLKRRDGETPGSLGKAPDDGKRLRACEKQLELLFKAKP